jgi:hypothetical protein
VAFFASVEASSISPVLPLEFGVIIQINLSLWKIIWFYWTKKQIAFYSYGFWNWLRFVSSNNSRISNHLGFRWNYEYCKQQVLWQQNMSVKYYIFCIELLYNYYNRYMN